MTSKMNPGMFLSTRSDYETPDAHFQALNAIFGFNLDVAANSKNAKVRDNYITKEMDALKASWHALRPLGFRWTVAWMNPPWGLGVKAWTEKALVERANGVLTVGLLGARTDTDWFQEDVCQANHVLFWDKRIAFWLPCLECGETTATRYRPTKSQREQMTAAGVHPLIVTFPVCQQCASHPQGRWHGKGTNSPAVGSMSPIWLPDGMDLEEPQLDRLEYLGRVLTPRKETL